MRRRYTSAAGGAQEEQNGFLRCLSTKNALEHSLSTGSGFLSTGVLLKSGAIFGICTYRIKTEIIFLFNHRST